MGFQIDTSSSAIPPPGAAEAYDEVPYESEPFPETHPERIGAIAHLFGLAVPPVARARVLEIGCAGGNNILPIAALNPDAYCVGLERSSVQLEEGRQRAARLGLKNIEFRAADIRDPACVEGQFDYIIAHGFFSWVAPEVQERMFEVLSASLTPEGLAYVSYNTLPGWYGRFPGREFLLLQVEGIRSGMERIAHARKVIAELLRAAHAGAAVPAQPSSLDRALIEQLRFYDKFPDWYLYHDILEGENHPTYLSSFVTRADRHGLGYVGDSDLSRMVPFDLAPEQQRFLRTRAKSDLHLEQQLDFLRAEAFRRSILCKKGRVTDRNGAMSRLDTLYYSPLCDQVPAAPAPEVAGTAPTVYRFCERGGREFATENPVVAMLLDTRSAIAPRRSVSEIVDHVCAVTGASRADAEPQVREQLFNLLLSGIIAAHLGPGSCSFQSGLRPKTSELIRDYAKSGLKVVTLAHELLILDQPARELLAVLDGSQTVSELEKQQPGATEIVESLARNCCLLGAGAV